MPADVVLVTVITGRTLIVEPEDAGLADGPELTDAEADFELGAAWCDCPAEVVTRARRLLGLRPDPVQERMILAN